MLTMILTLAAISDVNKGKIPNWLIACGVALGGSKVIWQKGLEGLYMHLADLLVIFLPLFVCYLFRLLGAGDVKLILVIWLFLGTNQVRLMVIWLSFLVAGVMSFFAVMTSKQKDKKILKTSVRLGPAFLMGWIIYLGGSNFV